METFKPGDIVVHPNFPEIEKEIVRVEDDGYVWKYPGHDTEFYRWWGFDPKFENHYKKS